MTPRLAVAAFVFASVFATRAPLAGAQGTLPAPFVLDVGMGLRDLPGDAIALLGGSVRATYRPTDHCLHLVVESFVGSSIAVDDPGADALLVTGSLGGVFGSPHKRTFIAVGPAIDFGFARLESSGASARGFTSSVGMRALLRNRLRRGFHVHANLVLGAVIRPLELAFVTRTIAMDGIVVGFDLGASFDLATHGREDG